MVKLSNLNFISSGLRYKKYPEINVGRMKNE